jgi:hypothetical protein
MLEGSNDFAVRSDQRDVDPVDPGLPRAAYPGMRRGDTQPVIVLHILCTLSESDDSEAANSDRPKSSNRNAFIVFLPCLAPFEMRAVSDRPRLPRPRH